MSRQQSGRAAKVRALAERAGTVGEHASVAPAAAKRRPFTDADARRLAAPEKGNRVFFDVKPSGFGVRVTAAGSRAFVFDYRVRGSGQQRRHTIGKVGDWNIGAARAEAQRLRRLVDSGGDPRGDLEDEREAPTVADLCDRFEREHLPRKRPATIDSYKRLIRLHIKPHFGQFTKVADVSFSNIDKLHRKVTAEGSTYAANRCVAVLSKMFSLAIKWGLCDKNPCRGVERNAETKRRRYLSADELQRLTTALAEHTDRQFAAIIFVLLATGARRGEVLAMRWDGLTLTKGTASWTKAASETKQKREHSTPLSEPVRQLLVGIREDQPVGCDFVFPSSDSKSGHVQEVKKSWATLLTTTKISGLRLHDLRHSFASQLASSGASLPLIGALLGHSNPSTTARYSHLFDDPQREAVEKVGVIVGDANGDRHD